MRSLRKRRSQTAVELELKTIQFLWWTGLAGALIGTLAILKAVALVLRALKDIHELSTLTREAARGIATNTAAVSDLAGLEQPARGLHDAAARVATAVLSIERKLGVAEEDRSRDGG